MSYHSFLLRLALGTLVASPVLAQSAAPDSARLAGAGPPGFRPDTLLPVAATELGQALLTEYQRQPALLPLLPVGRYARTALSYAHEQGPFRRAQEATRAQAVSFQTEGLRDIKGWRLVGNFRFERQLQDSIRWSLTPAPAPARPYYLAASRPGNWNNQAYTLGAAGVRRWHRDRLSTGVLLDYEGGNYVRTNDPRPEVLRQGLRLGASVGYQLHPAWLLALAYAYGYGSEINTTTNASQLNDGRNDTPYTLYDVLGYGFLLNARFGVFRVQHQAHRGTLSLHHARAGQSWLLTAETERRREEFVKRAAPSGAYINDLVGTYDLTEARLRLTCFGAAGPAGRRSFQRAQLDYTSGRDHNNTYALGNNYVYSHLLARLEAGWQRRTGAAGLAEYALGAYFLDEHRADGSAGHRRDTRRAGLDVTAQLNRPLGSGPWRGLLGLHAAAEADAGSALRVPVTQQNRFSRAVIFPDYAYDQQATLRGGLRLGVERPATARVRLRLLAEGSYLAPLTTRANPLYSPDYVPSGCRWGGQLRLVVYH